MLAYAPINLDGQVSIVVDIPSEVYESFLYMVCSYVESNSVLVSDGDTTSAVSPTRRGAPRKTYRMRNHRRNVYASLEV